MNTRNILIRLATKAAHDSEFRRARVGACIVRGGRVLSVGCNRIGYSSFHLHRRFPESIHAEAQAILELLKRKRLNELANSTIYVSRIGKDGRTRRARPCINCLRLIESVGIRKVVYTVDNGTEELRI